MNSFISINLTNTTFLKWDNIMKEYRTGAPDSSQNIKFELVEEYIWTGKKEVSTIFHCNLSTTDEFLKLFKKDYTILDKFKDYYK